MNEDFRTGGPPIWRVAIYALIAMAIPVYLFYPRLGELSPSLRVLFWFTVVFIGGGVVVGFAALPWIASNLKNGPTWFRRFIQSAFIAALVFAIVCRVLALIWK